MRKLFTVPAFLLAVGFFSAPAFAEGKGKHGHRGEITGQFPMKGDEFKTKVAALITGARGKMEKVITKKKVGEDKAKEIRAQFDAAVVKINAATDKVVEDGSVTKEEAESVQTVAREALPHPKHEGKGKPKK